MRRQEQQEQLRRARQQGKIAYFNVDRLVVKERVFHSRGSFEARGNSYTFGSEGAEVRADDTKS